MEEGERMPLVDSDFPEDALPEKSAHMTQVETQTLLFQPADMFDLHIQVLIIGVSNTVTLFSSLCSTWQSITSCL